MKIPVEFADLYLPVGRILRATTTVDAFLDRPFSSSDYFVYFLVEGHEIFYVGQTRNPPLRMLRHRDSYPRWSGRMTILPVPDARDVDDVEGFYIDLLNPPENRMDGRPTGVARKMLAAAKRGSLQYPCS